MTADQSDKTSLPEDGLEEEASTDWEEAFQAEDYLIPPEAPPQAAPEASAEKGRQQAEEAVLAAASGAKKGRAPVRSKKKTDASAGVGGFFEILGGNRFASFLFGLLPQPLRQLSVFGSTMRRGVAVALVVILGCSLFLALVSRPKQKMATENGSPARAAKSSPAVARKTVTPPPAVTKPARPAVTASPPAAARPMSKRGLAEPGVIRRKWRFPSFMIDASQRAGGAPHYVMVDLTLLLRLHAGETLPENKKYAVREMIYQFFSNRPPYELRRFSLARGEMGSKLEAWFRKEWPHNPIESIFFNRYQFM